MPDMAANEFFFSSATLVSCCCFVMSYYYYYYYFLTPVLNSHGMKTHTHTFNGPSSWTTRVSQYQKGKTNLDFTEARDREWQWHQLGHMQVCT